MGKVQTPVEPTQDHTTSPTCVGIRAADGEVCGRDEIYSPKYQLCNTCYTRACRKKLLSTLTKYKKDRFIRGPKAPPKEDSTTEGASRDKSSTFAYGAFDTAGMEPWERSFVLSRKKDVTEHFEDPTSKGIAHRWVLAELLLEQLNKHAEDYQAAEDFAKLTAVLTQMDKVEKRVQGLQKELNFLPSQTMEDKKIEDIFSNMITNHRIHKATHVAEFDHAEIELMAKKGMDVEFETMRISEITGRLAKERARALVMVTVGAALDVTREVFGLDDEQATDLMERFAVRLKDKVPEIIPLVD